MRGNAHPLAASDASPGRINVRDFGVGVTRCDRRFAQLGGRQRRPAAAALSFFGGATLAIFDHIGVSVSQCEALAMLLLSTGKRSETGGSEGAGQFRVAKLALVPAMLLYFLR